MEVATRRTTSAGALLVALLAAPVLALAQGPVLSFDQLHTRLRLGATAYVTDAQDREIKGKTQSLAPDALTLDGDRVFAAPYVSAIRVRQRSHAVRNGALIGVASVTCFLAPSRSSTARPACPAVAASRSRLCSRRARGVWRCP